MANNLTWQELSDANDGLISVVNGVLISSSNHRVFNLLLAEYNNSFNDWTTTLTADNQLTGSKLVKRVVSKMIIVDENTVLGKTYLQKSPNWAGDTLNVVGGPQYPAGTKVTVSFEQDPTRPM